MSAHTFPHALPGVYSVKTSAGIGNNLSAEIPEPCSGKIRRHLFDRIAEPCREDHLGQTPFRTGAVCFRV